MNKDEIREVRALLAALAKSPPVERIEQPPGSRGVVLSFSWRGESRLLLSGDGRDCPAELARLIEIANAAFKRRALHDFRAALKRGAPHFFHTPIDVCTAYQEQTRHPAAPDRAPVRLTLAGTSAWHPYEYLHHERALTVTWFEQPSTNSYHKLDVWIGPTGQAEIRFGRCRRRNSGEHRCDVKTGQAPHGVPAWLTGSERQEVHAFLELLADAGSVEQPVGTTTITLGLPWEADVRAATYGDQNCPAGLRRLFEIAGAAAGRSVAGLEIPSPCRPEEPAPTGPGRRTTWKE